MPEAERSHQRRQHQNHQRHQLLTHQEHHQQFAVTVSSRTENNAIQAMAISREAAALHSAKTCPQPLLAAKLLINAILLPSAMASVLEN